MCPEFDSDKKTLSKNSKVAEYKNRLPSVKMQQSIRQLSPLLQLQAIHELNENPASIAEEIEVLKHGLSLMPHLNARTDDQFLLTFLRGSKHDIKKALAKIEMFYTCRTALPEIMTNRDPLDPHLREVINLG